MTTARSNPISTTPNTSEEDTRMTTTTDAPQTAVATIAAQQQAVQQAPQGPHITQDIQQRVAQIEVEMGTVIQERQDVIHGALVARVAQQHLLMLGPGGTGKSFLVRDLVSHISDASHFETALDETTDPAQVFGPPDIRAMVDDGKMRRVVTGMLPEATDAFVDEIFNGNSPVLHSLMPALNERVFHNNGMPSSIPLRSCYAGTNKLNSDADVAAFFDRLHIRYVVGYTRHRTSRTDMISQAIGRMAINGRGTSTSLGATTTQVTVAELDQAHQEALGLDVPQKVFELFLDVHEGLKGEGIEISDRRVVEGMAAVLANAWVRGHTTVQAYDLDILANMWWSTQDQIDASAKLIMGVVNPGEAAAIELTNELAKIQAEIRKAQNEKQDDTHMRRIGIEVVRNTTKLIEDAKALMAKAAAAGTSTTRVEGVINQAETFKMKVGREVFGIDPSQMAGA